MMTLPSAKQLDQLYYAKSGTKLSFVAEGYAQACGLNCESDAVGHDFEHDLPLCGVFLKQAHDSTSVRMYFDGEKVNKLPLVDFKQPNVGYRWAFFGAGIMPRLENPAAQNFGIKKIGNEEFVAVGDNIVTLPRHKVGKRTLIQELNQLRQGKQPVDELAMSNRSSDAVPFIMHQRYSHPNGCEYLYVDNIADQSSCGWYVCEPVHGTLTPDNALQVTDVIVQTYCDTFTNYRQRKTGLQPGEELDFAQTHIEKLMNTYLLPAMVRSAERSHELTQKMVHNAERRRKLTKQIEQLKAQLAEVDDIVITR